MHTLSLDAEKSTSRHDCSAHTKERCPSSQCVHSSVCRSHTLISRSAEPEKSRGGAAALPSATPATAPAAASPATPGTACSAYTAAPCAAAPPKCMSGTREDASHSCTVPSAAAETRWAPCS
eukprot:scaffold57755_cov63-Phaeocystis_antarctica.AAC.1